MDPRKLGCKCKRCPFAKHGQPNMPVFGEGPQQPIGIFVGESPGRDEAERGRPFVGATGQELDNSFAKVELPRASLFVVNAICCMPFGVKSVSRMAAAANRCRPALLHQLLQLKGIGTTRIFAAGKWAYYALAGTAKGIKTKRGFLREWDIKDTVKANKTFMERLSAKARARRAKEKKTRK